MILLLIVVVIVVVAMVMYNSLVGLRERAVAAWSDIDVQLKRRYDLIPNVVETVKGYASHEKDTLERVIQARNAAMSAAGPAEKGPAENVLAGALRQLFALSEAYPDLKAQANFGELQDTLAQLETEIGNARRYYNAVVRDYNTKTQTVPTNIIARSFGFEKKDFFEVEESEKAVPEVNF